jgi:SagB-type dehydrogenase family enzyme
VLAEKQPFILKIHNAREVKASVSYGLLDMDSEEFKKQEKWENVRWTRSAYLLMTQQDIPYQEEISPGQDYGALVESRREAIRSMLQESPYEPIDYHPGPELKVPDMARSQTSFSRQLARRSVRRYSSEKVPLKDFYQFLNDISHNPKLAATHKATGDDIAYLNSFYTWLKVYIAVQGVEGIERGLYQFDPYDNRLILISDSIKDRQIAGAIQNQFWIGGGGFSIFVGVRFDRYYWVYRHARAYINLIIQLGEIGQEIVRAYTNIGLGGWMTPAVDEPIANALCKVRH